jgi:microtubule-associated protein-like 1/2
MKRQDDEILCLKSTFADILHRLKACELKQAQLKLNSGTKPERVKSEKSKNGVENGKTKAKTEFNKEPKQPSLDVSVISRKEQAGNNKALQNMRNSHGSSASSSINLRTPRKDKKPGQIEISLGVLDQDGLKFDNENGSLKFYLRGRPITLYLPSSFKDEQTNVYKFDTEHKLSAPKEQLKLEWVYGYRGKDCRSNLYQLPTGEIVYFIASVVVLFNVEERTQRHYLGHTDDIKAIAIHPDKITIATGQSTGHNKQEGRAHVRIWDSITLNTLKVIGLTQNDFTNSICCISFSKTDAGEHLAVVDDANEQRWLSVWKWNESKKLISTKCSGDMIFAAEFHPTDSNQIITCGKQHLSIWQLDSDRLTKRSCVFELNANTVVITEDGLSVTKLEKPKFILCVTFAANGEVITGDSDGNIIFWNSKDSKMIRLIKDAHMGGVFSVHYLDLNSTGQNNVCMVSGGKDGKIVEWNEHYHKTGRQFELPEVNGTCRFISAPSTGNMLLIGTTKNCIFQANFDLNHFKCLMNGHFEELWGLCSDKKSDTHFLTCGNDKCLNYWDSSSHSLLWSIQLEDQLHCVDIHPQYEIAVVGLNKAKWIVFDLIERKQISFQIEPGNEQIECIKYSPNGSYLACGSRDNSIYVYSVSENGTKYARVGKCTGHSSFIKHIDWSIDGEYIMSNSGDYEVLVWQASTCKQLTQLSVLRDIQFATNSCSISFNSFGIWHSMNQTARENGSNSSVDGTHFNASCSSNSKTLFSSVDDFGLVNLFKYPCSTFHIDKHSYSGHSSHVTNVQFINDDQNLISTGGNDTAVFQWSLN